MESVWRKYLTSQSFNEVKNSANLDTVVVGGGIAGIMCAYMLSKSGHKVTLIEAGKILEGVTANTTAHVTALQGKYSDIPTKKARQKYFESQVEAIDGIEALGIDCDFQRVDSFVFGERKELKKEFKLIRRFCDVEYRQGMHLPFGVFDCIKLSNQAQFNPIKFCYGLISRGKFDVIENCRIKKVSLMRKKLKTEDKVFTYKCLVLATGFPIVNIRGIYAFKMYKSFSYAVCAETGQKIGAIYNSIAGDGLTYRDSADGIIVGGLDHRTGRVKCNSYFDTLKQEMRKFGDSSSAYSWAANDCMTFDAVPYAGRLLRFRAKDAYVITGFGKWGMANSIICAKIVDDTIGARKNKYKRLFKPTRVLNVTVWPKFLWNFLQNMFGLVAGVFSSGKRRCPHMGCRLKFNPNTATYDCPCHGSRLTRNGDIITSPSVDANEKLM